jgi:hypothetical protein
MIEDVLFADYWDDKHKRPSFSNLDLITPAKYKAQHRYLILPRNFQLNQSAPDHVMTAAVGLREWFLIKQDKIGELIPNDSNNPHTIRWTCAFLKPGLTRTSPF